MGSNVKCIADEQPLHWGFEHIAIQVSSKSKVAPIRSTAIPNECLLYPDMSLSNDVPIIELLEAQKIVVLVVYYE